MQIVKLLPSDGAVGDGFGYSIDMANGVVAVGAWPNNGSDSGSAYLFDASTGVQLFKLLPNDGAAGDLFGISIAIANGIVAVGARYDDANGWHSGSAYLFDVSTGVQLAKLLPSDGAANDQFGFPLAMANGVVAVGAHADDDNGNISGSAYLFDADPFSPSFGTQTIKLLPNDGAAGDLFGFPLAIANGVVAVGAHWDNDNGSNSGSAYLFDASTGSQLFKLLPNDGAAGDEFGISIGMANGVVAVGARYSDANGSNSGSAYLFDTASGIQISKLLPTDGAAGDEFGVQISIDNGIVAVGAQFDDDNGIDSGSAYLFDTVVKPCIADLSGDGVLDFFDVSGFLLYFQIRNPIADFTGDGSFDFFDVSAFLTAFSAGCP